jgi:LDH2 family malate/lactate/ureidoglycolate dehydrogenase
MTSDNIRYSAQDLIIFSTRLLTQHGLPQDMAVTVAEILVEADLMGHTTHGLNLLGSYLSHLETGVMAKAGQPTVIADHGSSVTWNGHYLPGPWLTVQAMELAFDRIASHPVVTIAIQRSHHIACLAAYPKLATDRGYFMFLCSSGPNNQTVAPYGGLKAVYTPNPIGIGIPTKGEPIIIDVSMSTTSNTLIGRHQSLGQPLPHAWLQDNEGNATDDASVLSSDPPGTVMPLGGLDLGYKGFALGLMVEAMTSALAGYGRSDNPDQWGVSVFLQMINPDAFGGLDKFTEETQWLADACRANPPRVADSPVRMPGQRGLQWRAEQLEAGVILYPSIMPSLEIWAERLNVNVPQPLTP